MSPFGICASMGAMVITGKHPGGQACSGVVWPVRETAQWKTGTHTKAGRESGGEVEKEGQKENGCETVQAAKEKGDQGSRESKVNIDKSGTKTGDKEKVLQAAGLCSCHFLCQCYFSFLRCR